MERRTERDPGRPTVPPDPHLDRRWLILGVIGIGAPDVLRRAAVEGYVTGFRWAAAIFALGAVVTAALLRSGVRPVAGHGAPDPVAAATTPTSWPARSRRPAPTCAPSPTACSDR